MTPPDPSPDAALVARGHKASQAIYIAVEPEVAGDISEILMGLCAAVERLTREREEAGKCECGRRFILTCGVCDNDE